MNPADAPMLHHLSLGVSDIERSARFYDAVLAPLGRVRVWSDLRPGEPGQAVGYGDPGGGDKLALKLVPPQQAQPSAGFHVAFSAPSPAAVQAFHAAALAAGGCDNGPPGLRPHYGPDYYAAFVRDPDGHALEAVHKPAVAARDAAPQRFDTRTLPAKPTVTAPDGSDVRVLPALARGSLAHFQLAPGRTSAAVEHRSVEELWYVIAGRAEMWRLQGEREEIVALQPGTALSIPAGTRFQFRTLGTEPFQAVGTTMPPWPGADEAMAVDGPWPAG